MKAGEIGVVVVVGTSYDLSGKTSLTVTIINPDGTTQTVADGDISISASPYASSHGTFAGNTYAMFDTTATMFEQSQIASGASTGTWSAYLTYVDATKTLYSDTFTITVDAVP
jgi:hypothetical protein